jgi:ABC-type multidrug transport system permease subunit
LFKILNCSETFADDIGPWMIWGYYISPMMYGQNAIVLNEFLDDRWSVVRILNKFL